MNVASKATKAATSQINKDSKSEDLCTEEQSESYEKNGISNKAIMRVSKIPGFLIMKAMDRTTK